MKAIVVRQPWAWAVVAGIKSIENRTWKTAYRGPLAIVAGRSRAALKSGSLWLKQHGFQLPNGFEFGQWIGTVKLDDIKPYHPSLGLFASGPYCWMLSHPRILTPMPYRGQLGLFEMGLPQTESRASILTSPRDVPSEIA